MSVFRIFRNKRDTFVVFQKLARKIGNRQLDTLTARANPTGSGVDILDDDETETLGEDFLVLSNGAVDKFRLRFWDSKRRNLGAQQSYTDRDALVVALNSILQTTEDDADLLDILLLDGTDDAGTNATDGIVLNAIDAIGTDEDGDIYITDLEACGVDHGFKSERRAGTTGKCLVLITPDAERSMNTFLGVSETLSVTEVNEAAISASTWVYLEGYLVTSPTGHAAALKTKQLAEANNTKVAVSFSDPGMVTFFRDNMNAMLEGGVDFVFCNEIEALEWAQTDNLDEAAERLKAICQSFVITRGANGAILYDGTSTHQVASEKVTAVNTNGAGDMFAGAFFYGLGQGLSMVAACEFASKAASIVVCQAGPRLSMQAARAVRDAHFRN